MAILSKSRTVRLPDGNLWTVQAQLDTVTKQITVTILNQSGQQVGGIGSPNDQIAFIQEALGGSQPQTTQLLISAIRDLSESLRTNASTSEQDVANRARDDAGVPTVGSGTVVVNAQTARDDGANPVLPVGIPLPPLTPTNATPTPTGTNTDPGTDGRVRPVTETQSTNPQQPPGQGRPIISEGPSRIEIVEDSPDRIVLDVALNTSRPGVGAASDDRSQPNTTQARLDQLYGAKSSPIKEESNILSNFASYTYSLSWYLVEPEAYRELISQQKRDLKGFYLLVQSGGIGQNTSQTVAGNQQLPLSQQSPQVTPTSAGREQFFPLDFYIDNLEVQVLYPSGSESRSAAAFKDLSFTLTEPNGLSLLPNLYAACDDMIRQGGALLTTGNSTNYAAAMFCMVIKFYGYDENGVLQQPITNNRNITDRSAVIEKFIPFTLKDIKFSVGPRMVEYTIEGASPEVRAGLDTNRGSIPQDFSLSGTTVESLLVGAAPPAARNGAAAGDGRPESAQPEGAAPPPAPAKADNAPKPAATITATGLVEALNKFQQARRENGVVKYADVYEIKFADNIIAAARARPPGELNKNTVGGNSLGTAADQKLPEKSAMSPDVRNRSVRAGTPIIQFIDEVIRNSSYITDQAFTVYNEKTKTYSPNGKPAEQFAWFNVVVKSEIIPGTYDEKRNDYAYKITYFVTPYETPMVSQYFNPSGFRGFHKIYNWLFTGENTEVLQFEQNFDKLWTQALTADADNLRLIQQRKRQMSSREQWFRNHYPASGIAAQGGDTKLFEPGANAADFLYGPNYGRIELNIVGDPAWLPNAYYEYNTNTFSTAAFWPDGTINSTAGAAYFELAFNRPVDYNLDNGLMDAGRNNLGADREKGIAGVAAEAVTYRAIRCKNVFRGGRFSQDLEGAWVWDQTFNEPVDQRQTDPADPRQGRGFNRAEEVQAPTVPRVAGDGSSTARGVQQILNPPTQSLNPTLTQLTSSQAYITARQAGVPGPEALEIARQAFAAGTAGQPYNSNRPPTSTVREP
jgi:hypothetical protein